MAFLAQKDINGERLMVIDNVDDSELDLAIFLPRWASGTVVITSRSAARGELGPSAHIELDVMSLEESLELLSRGMGDWPLSVSKKPINVRLVRELGRHPIAILQAISYMWNTKTSPEDYIARLGHYRTQLTRDYPATSQLDMRYRTVFAAFNASYDIMPRNVQMFCHVLSFFHWRKFPRDLIMLAVGDRFSTIEHEYTENGDSFKRGVECLEATFCSPDPLDEIRLDGVFAELVKHSLITVIHVNGTILLEMHQLVHQWGRLHISAPDLEQFQDAAIRLLCCGAKRNNYLMMQHLFNHVMALKSAWKTLHANDSASFSFILDQSGLHEEAAELMEITYITLKTQLGTDHQGTIRASLSLAGYYTRLGRHTEALILRQMEDLRRNREMFGENYPDNIASLAELMITLRQSQREDNPMVQNTEFLIQQQQILGPSTQEPSKLIARILDINDYLDQNGNTGLENAGSLTRMATLVVVPTRDNSHGGGIIRETEILRITEDRLGERDPQTISALEDLASKCSYLEQHKVAETMMKRVLALRIEVLGADNPHTIKASAHLAMIYEKLGNYDEAIILENEVMTQRERVMGEGHKETIEARFRLARTYHRLGQSSEAERLMERAKEIISELPGNNSRLSQTASRLLESIKAPFSLYNVSNVCTS